METLPASSPVEYDPFRPHQDPYPLYTRLRDEAPLYRSNSHRFWALSRFADVQAAARDSGTYSSAEGNDLDDTYQLMRPGSPESADPPLHTRLRKVLQPHFNPRGIKSLESFVRLKVELLLDACSEAPEPDLVQSFAFPLPHSVVCGLLGFPEADHELLAGIFRRMSDREPGQTRIPKSAWNAKAEMSDYIVEAAAQRRRKRREDLMSKMVDAERSGLLEREEIVGMAIILFYAGIITTVGLVSNSLLTLAREPHQRRILAQGPDRIPQAIEELLRFEAPLQWLTRVTTRDVEVHGQTVPAGERVLLMWGSANRDERRWHDPDRLDVTRAHARHLAFGEGIHHCLGAPLARLEGRIALEAVLQRFPDYTVSEGVESKYSPSERSLSRLPVVLS